MTASKQTTDTERVRPLYGESRSARQEPGGNAGLWYDKFCDRWPADVRTATAQEVGLGTEKANWIRQATRGPAGEKTLLDDYYARRRKLVERLGGRLMCMTTSGRLVTGLGRSHPVENGFAWHPTLGSPYLPGSSLKGLVRTWARDESRLTQCLGSREGRGGVMVLDALPLRPVMLEVDVMTPHYGDYYRGGEEREAPGDWMSPTPIPFLVVAPGTRFHFGLIPRGEQARAELDEVAGWLKRALSELGAGAKTAVGYGFFHPSLDEPPACPERWLNARERVHQIVESMPEREALGLARRFERGEALDPKLEPERELVREILIGLYYEPWSAGRKTDDATNFGAPKLRQYASALKPAAQTPAAAQAPAPPAAPSLDDEEAACIESCRDDKARIKEVGDEFMRGEGPIRSAAGRAAFLEVAQKTLDKGRKTKKTDRQWLENLKSYLREQG